MSEIMIIAGSDSSGGAGLTRDTAVATMLGVKVLPVVTAVTAQTNAAIIGTRPVPADFVAMQIEAAFASGSPRAVKIGMLGTGDIADAVAEALARQPLPVVIDPVLKSSSGGRLISGRLSRRLISQASLVTPNLLEAAALTGLPVAKSDAEIAAQAKTLISGGARAVLIKGGHGQGARSTDHLFEASGHREFSAPRLSTSKRGTGCALSTAIACHLALGRDLSHACARAKAFVHAWLGDMSESEASP